MPSKRIIFIKSGEERVKQTENMKRLTLGFKHDKLFRKANTKITDKKEKKK